jgi:hypothetical protein
MTSLPPPVPGPVPPDEAWELASAYLDNEVTPSERAQVESSSMLMALVEQLRPTVAIVRTPVTISADDREQALSRVLAAAVSNTSGASVPSSTASATVTPMTSARRPSRSTRYLAPLAAAAAVVAVIGIGGRLGRSTKTESRSVGVQTTVAAAALESASTTAAAAAVTSAASAPAPAAGTDTTAPLTAEPASTAAPASTVSATTTASATTAAAPATAVTTPDGVTAVTPDEATVLRRLLVGAQPFPNPVCPPPLDAGSAIATLEFRERQSTAFTNTGRTLVIVVEDASCSELARTSA